MYYLPGTRWYIAELIEEICVDGFPRQIIQRNARFIFAHSPEEAYEQALTLDSNSQNDEKLSHTRYWGLAHLNVVQEDLRQPEIPLVSEEISPRYPVHGWAAAKQTLVGLASD
ncbi:MAG: hypothetical protein DMG65_00535 [Candidatus Angelobacter sp. Gp1-AA117]|nr:MAG: hypothetical protein DMG65_00535 [Candidatus Angelobacter sp. Gp1-AA117]